MSLTVLISRLDVEVALRLPLLERLLVRADARPAPAGGLTGVLTELYGLQTGALAPAPLSRLADTGQHDDCFWLCAEPVQLAADRDQLVMLPLKLLDVQMNEAQALAESFNRMYAGDGFRLETPVPTRWYLRLPNALDCITHDPASIAGGPVFDYMPTGDSAAQLKQLMNEIQMLFHDHPVNQARDAEGKPAINAAWLWGGGRLPSIPDACAPLGVVTDIPLVRGLALLTGGEAKEWPVSMDKLLSLQPALLALSADNLASYETLESIAGDLIGGLRTGTLDAVNIHPGGKHLYRITRNTLRRFWRRSQPLIQLVESA